MARTTTERFDSKYLIDLASGCWLWMAATQKGYGAFGIGGRKAHKIVRAHRFSYERERGPIPAGLDLDHLCRVRRCVNPAHLEPVTRAVNVQRGDVPDMNRARATARAACPRGHVYDEPNTRRTPTGARYCLTCKRNKIRARRASEASHV